jgi:membrane protease YdiL (CAAX protease family)
MSDKQRLFKLYKESPLYQLFVSIVIVIGVGFALFLLLVIAGIFIFGSSPTVLEKPSGTLSNNDILFLRYLLIIQDISLLIIPSIIILLMMKPEGTAGFAEMKKPRLQEAGLVMIMTFCMFPVTSFTGQINSAMHLPDWLSGVEKWMIIKEDRADDLIDIIMTSDSFWILTLNLLIAAILPAIGEELIFRGIFQRIFYSLFKSGHLAILITAFIFSTLHFQFFGFVPRFILGVVFGYLFFWSGKLWLPVISHFVNNAYPVILAYTGGMEKFNRPSDVPLWQQAIFLPLPVTIILVILFNFRKNSIARRSG